MISSRTAKLIGYLPKGMLKYVSKKVVDRYLNKYANIKILGKENIENIKEPVIYIGNHLSNSDGLVLQKVLKDKNVTFVAGMKLSNNPLTNIGMSIVKSISIKPNSADKEAINSIIKTIKSGESIFIFPEGTRSRTGSMIEAKKGVVLIAKVTKVPIIPVGIWGTEKLMPINKEGDMGAEKFYHADVNVSFGKPISIPEKNKDEDKHQYNDRVLEYLMKSIANLLPEEYRGVYGDNK
ncbi:MAG: 1-acyl-sn-glycerol-3-phosphate acyltransferase [Clostridiales bacterium]|uniref:lysophospholipid acyltransferase family protein n=1 Tax=Clostridium sp. N3C TaxID=1776758 RepID=UPI00092E069C|nr:lysophospholipid acyltransferase family protein [Clostridium sp. N3C]NLZ47928.1 1-acyl-sn-glycerol-3-phosphate acyltransferase [Clostridiales bacterium]SCN22573.1 1-acyl-sn-glycerol-3-phosphate acyltransferase [Clostridium sp. N3C]